MPVHETLQLPAPGTRLHVAIIMDGNGRWAVDRNLPRHEGHIAGSRTLRQIVEAAPSLGVGTLTLYAFSSDNWRRPREEVCGLMRLAESYLKDEVKPCLESGVRLEVIGRRDRLPLAVRAAARFADLRTSVGKELHLRIALDYSSRDAILAAASESRGQPISREEFARLVSGTTNDGAPVPEVDLLVRTGGEQRLSDFLLWECAYAELYFTPRLWPEFSPNDLREALVEFRRRDRRFGAVPSA